MAKFSQNVEVVLGLQTRNKAAVEDVVGHLRVAGTDAARILIRLLLPIAGVYPPAEAPARR